MAPAPRTCPSVWVLQGYLVDIVPVHLMVIVRLSQDPGSYNVPAEWLTEAAPVMQTIVW